MDRNPSQSNLSDEESKSVAIIQIPESESHDGTTSELLLNVSVDPPQLPCTEVDDRSCDRVQTCTEMGSPRSQSVQEPPEQKMLTNLSRESDNICPTGTPEPEMPAVIPTNTSPPGNTQCNCGGMHHLQEFVEGAARPSNQQIGDVTMAINLTLIITYSPDSRPFTPTPDPNGATYTAPQPPVYSSECVCRCQSPPNTKLTHEYAANSPDFCVSPHQRVTVNQSFVVSHSLPFSMGAVNRANHDFATAGLLASQNQLNPTECVTVDKNATDSMNEVNVDSAPGLWHSCFMCRSKKTTPGKVSQMNSSTEECEIKSILNVPQGVPELAKTESQSEQNLVDGELYQPLASASGKSVAESNFVTRPGLTRMENTGIADVVTTHKTMTISLLAGSNETLSNESIPFSKIQSPSGLNLISISAGLPELDSVNVALSNPLEKASITTDMHSPSLSRISSPHSSRSPFRQKLIDCVCPALHSRSRKIAPPRRSKSMRSESSRGSIKSHVSQLRNSIIGERSFSRRNTASSAQGINAADHSDHSPTRPHRVFCFGSKRELNKSTEEESIPAPETFQVITPRSSYAATTFRNHTSPSLSAQARMNLSMRSDKMRNYSSPKPGSILRTVDDVERENGTHDEVTNSIISSAQELAPITVEEDNDKSICMPYLCLRPSSEARAQSTTPINPANTEEQAHQRDTSVSEADVGQMGETPSRRRFIKRCPFQRKSRSLSESSLQRLPLTYKGEELAQESRRSFAERTEQQISIASDKLLKDCVNSWGTSTIGPVLVKESQIEVRNSVGSKSLRTTSGRRCRKTLCLRPENPSHSEDIQQHKATIHNGTLQLSIYAPNIDPNSCKITKNSIQIPIIPNSVEHKELALCEPLENTDQQGLYLDVSVNLTPDELVICDPTEKMLTTISCVEPIEQNPSTQNSESASRNPTLTVTFKQSEKSQTTNMETKDLLNELENLPVNQDYPAPEQNQLQLSSAEETVRTPVVKQRKGCFNPIRLFCVNVQHEPIVSARLSDSRLTEVTEGPSYRVFSQPNLLLDPNGALGSGISTHSWSHEEKHKSRHAQLQHEPTYANESLVKQRREKAKKFNVTEVPVVKKSEAQCREQADQAVTGHAVNKFDSFTVNDEAVRQSQCTCGFDQNVLSKIDPFVGDRSQIQVSAPKKIKPFQCFCPASETDPVTTGDIGAVNQTTNGLWESQTIRACSRRPYETWVISPPFTPEIPHGTITHICDVRCCGPPMPRLTTVFPGPFGRISIQFSESVTISPTMTNCQQLSSQNQTEDKPGCNCCCCCSYGNRPVPNQRSNCCANLTATDSWSNQMEGTFDQPVACASNVSVSKLNQVHHEKLPITARSERFTSPRATNTDSASFIMEDHQTSMNDSHALFDEYRLFNYQSVVKKPSRDLSSSKATDSEGSDPNEWKMNFQLRRDMYRRMLASVVSSSQTGDQNVQQQNQQQKQLTTSMGDISAMSMSHLYNHWEQVTISLVPITNLFSSSFCLAVTQISCIPTRCDVQLCQTGGATDEDELHHCPRSVTHSGTQTTINYCSNEHTPQHSMFTVARVQSSAMDLMNKPSSNRLYMDDDAVLTPVSEIHLWESKHRSEKHRVLDMAQSNHHDQQHYYPTPIVSQIMCPDLKDPSRESSPSTSLDMSLSSRSLPPVIRSEEPTSSASSDKSTLTLHSPHDAKFEYKSPRTEIKKIGKATSTLEQALGSFHVAGTPDTFPTQPKNVHSSGALTSLDRYRGKQQEERELHYALPLTNSKWSLESISSSIPNLSHKRLYYVDSDLSGRSSSLPVIPSPIGMVDYLQQFRHSQSFSEVAGSSYPNATETAVKTAPGFPHPTSSHASLVIVDAHASVCAEQQTLKRKNTNEMYATTKIRTKPEPGEYLSCNRINDTRQQQHHDQQQQQQQQKRRTYPWNNNVHERGSSAGVCPNCPSCGYKSRTTRVWLEPNRTARTTTNVFQRKPVCHQQQNISTPASLGTKWSSRDSAEQRTPSVRSSHCHFARTIELEPQANTGEGMDNTAAAAAAPAYNTLPISRVDSSSLGTKNLAVHRCQCGTPRAVDMQPVNSHVSNSERDRRWRFGLSNFSLRRSVSQVPSFDKSGFRLSQQPAMTTTTTTAIPTTSGGCCCSHNTCNKRDRSNTNPIFRHTTSLASSKSTEPLHYIVKPESDCPGCKRPTCAQSGHAYNCSFRRRYQPLGFR